jgi:hypothetical protein
MTYSDGEGYTLRNFTIEAQAGTPARHGINLDITAVGQHLKNMTIEKLIIRRLGGNGIY